MTDTQIFQRRRLHPGGQGDPDPQGIARRPTPMSRSAAAGAPRSTTDLAAFLAEANSFYLATASADGQPYIQHRGGPKGFIQVLDKNDAGVRRLQRQPAIHHAGQSRPRIRKAYIFLMDYAHRRRVKIWGEARVVEDDPALLHR